MTKEFKKVATVREAFYTDWKKEAKLEYESGWI